MTGAELKQIVAEIDDEATILEVLATSPNGIKRNMSVFHANRPMAVRFKFSEKITQPQVSDLVLEEARQAAKSATSYEELFQALEAIVVRHFPTEEARDKFRRTPHLRALRSILTEGYRRFDPAVELLKP